ncbi:MAG: XcyI family restriction endonuclease [Verrucomicrobia bacterium]|nr:XcyI family restriction endonuclease [Verrucomicrobiota bacterium]
MYKASCSSTGCRRRLAANCSLNWTSCRPPPRRRSRRNDRSWNKLKNVVAIEVKGGTDKSNIWNRLGEAEKSHQSAKQRGFVEFWTIYNVPNLDLAKAREKSPTTNRFYSLSQLCAEDTEAFADFRDRLVSLVGIAARSG